MIKNLVTGTTFNEKSSSFILNSFSEGKVAYEKFRNERLEIKSTKLFDTTPKSTSSFKKGKPWKAPDIKEETVNFLLTVNYLRLRGFDVEYLLYMKSWPLHIISQKMENYKNPQNQNLPGN